MLTRSGNLVCVHHPHFVHLSPGGLKTSSDQTSSDHHLVPLTVTVSSLVKPQWVEEQASLDYVDVLGNRGTKDGLTGG